jgi:phosphoenolpyruvate carboxykinase (ATP)
MALAQPGSKALHNLERHGLKPTSVVHANLSAAILVEKALARGEGILSSTGALVARTGARTGRSPQDRFLVVAANRQGEIDWGTVNRPIDPAVFERLHAKVLDHLQSQEIFVNDCWACADARYRLSVRVITDKAWAALFARCLLLRPGAADLGSFEPELTVLHAADLRADPALDGTRSDAFIILNLEMRLVLIGGTHYAGEIKKAVFSFLNDLMPRRGVMPMHCSANVGADGATALFFGLSGTGKTTLSADPTRRLIGDDEHGWSEFGVFNFEGGCYAKTIRLSREGEPQIWNAIRFGCVLENVVVDPQTRQPDYDSERFTENTRAAYPIELIEGCELSGCGGHPAHVIFLTCDAFGVLPPVSRLSTEQAMYHFLSGYTAKIAGTEAGVTEPKATFSTCFAAPFLPRSPMVYAEMLGERLRRHGSQVWLVNTGWNGGPYGQGSRIKLGYTRAMVRAILDGTLATIPTTADPVFGVSVPQNCPGVPSELLQPRTTWKDPADYAARARALVGLFNENFKTYRDKVPAAVREAGPPAQG